MQRPHDDELVLVSGGHPIRADMARYYDDHHLQARILPPPPFAVDARVAGDADKPIPAAKVDWQGAFGAPPSLDTEDPANAGICRNPELPEHIITAPRKPPRSSTSRMTKPTTTRNASVLQSQLHATARHGSLDPADDGL